MQEMKFYDREKELDLIAVDAENKALVIGEVKRNLDKISIPKLQEKSVKVLAYHKKWDSEYVGLSLEDM